MADNGLLGLIYHIYKSASIDEPRYTFATTYETPIQWYDTLEEAMDAANEDYKKRIKQALGVMSLRSVISNTEIQASRLEDWMKELRRWLIFYHFEEDDKPTVVYEDGEVLLRWHEYTLTMNKVTELMEEVGYISKEDFIL